MGIPQIVAPAASDMVDFQTWRPLPEKYKDRPYHAHNRLIASVTMTPEERRGFAHHVGGKLAAAKGPTVFVLPNAGFHAWDRPGEALYEPDGIKAMVEGFREAIRPPAQLVEIDAHVNDALFSDTVLSVFDEWVRRGVVVPGVIP